METLSARRPLKSRELWWAIRSSRALARAQVSPNTISIFSGVFAAIACTALLLVPVLRYRDLWLLLAAAGIQLRLACNLLDGMVAVEGGMKTKSGEVFNDLPDRIADTVIIVPAGYAAVALPWGPALGWSAGLLAVLTAYVRMMGGAAGLKQSFIGPMAKQQRMAVMTAACLLSTIEHQWFHPGTVMWTALVIINLGCVATIARRTARIVRELEAR